MEASEVKMGIVGMGNMGSIHAQHILDGKVPGMKLTAVCDVDPARLKPWADREGVSTFTEFSAMLASGQVNSVIIATPHYSHTTYGIEALQAGLHVVVEKPISVHKADCERLISAYKGDGQVFAAMFNQRTEPSYRKLKQLISSGELGKIHRVNWIITDWYRTQSYYDSGGWRATWAGEGGGVLLNQCPHQLDLYQWLFGMPNRVRAFCQIGRFHKIEVEDSVTAYLEHADGATGVFISTTGEAPGTNRLEVAGDRGKVIIEGGRFRFTRNEEGTTEHLANCKHGFTRPDVWEVEIPLQPPAVSGHIAILRNFTDAVLRGEPLVAPAQEGTRSVELANLMLYSSATGETLELPLDPTAYEVWLKKKIAGSRFEKPVTAQGPASDFSKSF